MNQTHIHLLITHLPIFGSILGFIVLAYAMKTKSKDTITAAYIIFIISALGAGIAYNTGEAAEETVEQLVGVSENTIEEHEDAALFALITTLILGGLSLLAIIFNTRNIKLGNRLPPVILFVSLFSFAVLARTGYLGGKIMHSEIYNTTQQPKVSAHDNDED